MIDPDRYLHWGGIFPCDPYLHAVFPREGIPLVRQYTRWLGKKGELPYIVSTKNVGMITRVAGQWTYEGFQHAVAAEVLNFASIPEYITYSAADKVFIGGYDRV